MRRSFFSLGAIGLLCALSAQAVMVDGTVLLSGHADFSGTKALFRAVSPSAATDSTLTDAAGYFSLDLSAGVYDVSFSHDDFIPRELLNQAYLSPATLDTITLEYQPLPELAGDIWGNIGPGDFLVTGDLHVTGAGLTILPGTRLLFTGPHELNVQGILTAVGTEDDSIIFTRSSPTDESCWGGIRFANHLYPDEQSRLEYCTIEWATKIGSGMYESYGGGILTFFSSPTISHCRIQHNQTTSHISAGGGGGIACINGSPVITDCDISDNSTLTDNGGGVYCGGGTARFERCNIHSNLSMAYGGGVSVYGDGGQFVDCRIHGNRADDGGGIYLSDDSQAAFLRCVVSGNIAESGAGFYGTGTAARFERCTFVENGAITFADYYLSASTAIITSCIFTVRPSEIGLHFDHSPNAVICYCDFFGNPLGFFSFTDSDPQNGPAAIGMVALTNANDDSSDTYYNIFLDPQFVDYSAGDYHLTQWSSCIDAGDPFLDLDPDSTIADMGAFYFPSTMTVKPADPTAASDYGLLQNYPNPFNPATEIVFALPRSAFVTLGVYDILGRQIALLENGTLPSGQYRRTFDGSALSSGVYFCILRADGVHLSRKMVLMK